MYKRFLAVFIWVQRVFAREKPSRFEPTGELAQATVPVPKVSLEETRWLKGELFQEAQRFVATQRSPHTRRAYEGDLKQFLEFLLSEKLSGDSIDSLLLYRDWLVRPKGELGAGLSRLSANRKFATVRAFLSWLQMRGKLKENPGLWVKNFRAKTESPTLGFSDEEVAKILVLPKLKTESGLMHALMLHLLFYLGLRRSELVALKISHIARARAGEEMLLTVRIPGKGDKERILPVPAQVEPLLELYLKRRGLSLGEDKFLFSPVRNNVSGMKEKPLHPHAVYYVVKKYARKAGVEAAISPHSCRATAISNALDHAATHRAVQQMAGWSSPLMIERYDKRRTELRDSAVHLVRY